MAFLRSIEAEPALKEWTRRRVGRMAQAPVAEGEVDLALRLMRWAFENFPFFVAFVGSRALANA